VALTESLRLSKEPRVNIYTDSKYAFLILHVHTAIWKKREILTTIGTASHRYKRGYFNSFRDTSINCSPCWNHLWGDCQSCNCKNLTKVVEDTSDQVGLAIKDMQGSCHPFLYGMDHRLALDFLLAKKEGVCAIANTSCCTCINTSGIVEERADYILQQAKWLLEQSLETQVST
jgi:hypothetical protein